MMDCRIKPGNDSYGRSGERRDPYVDGPRATRVFQGLIGSLASICPAC